MKQPSLNSQPDEKKPPAKARRSRRLYARELQLFAHREICDQFEVRGPDSDIELAETFEAQRPSVVSVLVHELFRRLRRVERKQAMSENGGLRVVGREGRAA
jgi:hypothetical protein